MNLPLGFGVVDFSDWARGLSAAFISGGATAITTSTVISAIDAKDFSLGSGKFFTLFGTVFVTSGVISAMNFLRTRPLPEFKTVEKTVESTKIQGKAPVTVTTVKETSVEPKDPPLAT